MMIMPVFPPDSAPEDAFSPFFPSLAPGNRESGEKAWTAAFHP
jgi:hypothetical protein